MSSDVQLTGDWDRVVDTLSNAGIKIRRESRRAIGRSLKKVERKVLRHLDLQDLEWPELSEGYKDRKKAKGLSEDILRATNQMYSNITTSQPDSYSGMVGVARGVTDKNGDVVDIALIHEQPKDDGTKIPARKLWKPTFEETKDEVAAELKGALIEVFKR